MNYVNFVLIVALLSLSSTPSFGMNQKVKLMNPTKDRICAKSAAIALGNKLDFWGEPAVSDLVATEILPTAIYQVITSTEATDRLFYQIKVMDMRSEDGTCTATHFRISPSGPWESLY